MSSDDDLEYFRDRRRASMVMSLSASEPSVRKIHLQLADEYAALADELGRGDGMTSPAVESEQAGDVKSADLSSAASIVGAKGETASGGAVRPLTEPLDVAAVAGNVTMAARAERVTALTPVAAALTADRLMARGQQAARQAHTASTSSLPARNADWSSDVTTQGGYAFRIRQASNADRAATSAFSANFDPEGIQSSILSSLRSSDGRQKGAGHDEEGNLPRHYLAIETDGDRIIASAAAIRDQIRPTVWAVLIIRPDFQESGIRSRLLDYLSKLATRSGISTLVAIEEHSNPLLPDADEQVDWVVSRYVPDARYIVLSKTLPTS